MKIAVDAQGTLPSGCTAILVMLWLLANNKIHKNFIGWKIKSDVTGTHNFYLTVLVLTIKISQSQSKKLICCKKIIDIIMFFWFVSILSSYWWLKLANHRARKLFLYLSENYQFVPLANTCKCMWINEICRTYLVQCDSCSNV